MVIPIPAVYPQEVVINYYQDVQSPLVVGIDSALFDETSEVFLDTVKPSGIILMTNNIQDYDQTRSLIGNIHKYAKNRGIGIEVMVDEEGGIVSRFKNLERYPGYKGLHDYNEESARLQALFLKDIGIDTNLAPVTDIAFDPQSIIKERCAGDKWDKVADITSNYISKLHMYGVKSTIKHFPGHGRTNDDTHIESSKINIPYDTWLSEDAKPIVTAIAHDTEYIMLGHLIYTDIDSLPASVSSKWIRIIRENLHYKGELITDDLKMAALNETDGVVGCTWKGIKSQITDYAMLIKRSLDAGVNHPLIILTQRDMGQVYSKWIEIEKACE